MKLSVFGDFGKFTVVGLTKARLRMRLMKLSVLGETPNENNLLGEYNMSIFRQISTQTKKSTS
jgi:hypothetical protein